MGECGCEGTPLGKIQTSEGILVVEVYPGCEYCGASWALTLNRVAPGDRYSLFDADDLAALPEITFDQHGSWHHQTTGG